MVDDSWPVKETAVIALRQVQAIVNVVDAIQADPKVDHITQVTPFLTLGLGS